MNVSGDLTGETLGGRYLVGPLLARGGMATVYLATDTRLQRTVAMKVLRPDLSADPEFMARFLREARATAALSHPNVVSVFDFEASGQAAYLVLEYVPGHTLRHVLNQHRLSPSQALAVTDAILDALVAAHEAGILHRDIKPENVLIGPRSTIKVADFGLARAMDDNEHKTRTGLVIGTAAYVSPEHIAGTGTSTASDIYSTGILLFEMLTGSPPFAGENPLSVAYQHMNSDVPRPSERAPGIPTELDELVLGATARDPSDRFLSAGDFLAELRRARSLMPPAEPLPAVREDTSSTTVILDSAAAGAQLLGEDPTPEEDPHEAATVGLLEPSASDDASDETADQGSMLASGHSRGRTIALGALLALGVIAGLTWAFIAGPLQRGTVPSIVGLPQADAEAVLAERGMRLDVADEQYSETAPKGTVISQDPAAEDGAFIRFPIRAVMSLGPERYAVPDLRGQSVEEATTTLTKTKLTVAGQTEGFDDDVPVGAVAGSEPPAGTVLKPQTGVALIISKGPAPRPVPDVLGNPAAQAQSLLEAAGLVVQTSEDYSEGYAAGTAAATNPPAGTEVEKGSPVTLVISKGPPPVEVPRVLDLKRQDAINKLQAAGFKVKVLEGIVTPLDRVYSQDPSPGEIRPKGSTVSISIF